MKKYLACIVFLICFCSFVYLSSVGGAKDTESTKVNSLNPSKNVVTAKDKGKEAIAEPEKKFETNSTDSKAALKEGVEFKLEKMRSKVGPNGAFRELPPEFQKQLDSPPMELPEDMKRQLKGPTQPIPEDFKRALETPPRRATLEEVNGLLEPGE